MSVCSLFRSFHEMKTFEDRLLKGRVHRILGNELEKFNFIPTPLGGPWLERWERLKVLVAFAEDLG